MMLLPHSAIAEESDERAAFEEQFVVELAGYLDIDTTRVTIEAVLPGSRLDSAGKPVEAGSIAFALAPDKENGNEPVSTSLLVSTFDGSSSSANSEARPQLASYEVLSITCTQTPILAEWSGRDEWLQRGGRTTGELKDLVMNIWNAGTFSSPPFRIVQCTVTNMQ
jgi:hypothetical protein